MWRALAGPDLDGRDATKPVLISGACCFWCRLCIASLPCDAAGVVVQGCCTVQVFLLGSVHSLHSFVLASGPFHCVRHTVCLSAAPKAF
jgi:hypothetical protein